MSIFNKYTCTDDISSHKTPSLQNTIVFIIFNNCGFVANFCLIEKKEFLPQKISVKSRCAHRKSLEFTCKVRICARNQRIFELSCFIKYFSTMELFEAIESPWSQNLTQNLNRLLFVAAVCSFKTNKTSLHFKLCYMSGSTLVVYFYMTNRVT